jgi:hypothetical protein
VNFRRLAVTEILLDKQRFTKHTYKTKDQVTRTPLGCTRLAAASDKVYQLLAHGRWFSPGTPASSTTKTGCHDIAEILLKVALKHRYLYLSLCIKFPRFV